MVLHGAWIAYRSDLDEFVLPASSAMRRHPALAATNVAVPTHGHLSLPVSPAVARSVAAHLVHSTSTDSTSGRSVSPITTDSMSTPGTAVTSACTIRRSSMRLSDSERTSMPRSA